MSRRVGVESGWVGAWVSILPSPLKPATVRECAASATEPGVIEVHARHDDPHSGWSAALHTRTLGDLRVWYGPLHHLT